MTTTVELDERISKCQRILELDPNSQIFAALAEAFRKKGDFEKAFRICQNGLRIHPSYGSAHVVMAKINMDRGLYDWAEAEIKKSIELDGNSRAIELLLAEIYIYKGEFNAAVKLLRKLHQADQSNTQIRKLLDIALKIPQEQAMVMQGNQPPSPPTHLSDTPSVQKPEPRKALNAEAAGSLTAADVVRLAAQLPDIDGALFFSGEGLVIEQEWSAGLDPHLCAATMAEIGSFLNQELLKASFGKVNSLLVETAAPILLLIKVTSGMFLFVCNAKINLGTLRMRVSTLIERFHA
jgi:predicted regulator of Ras-like GTPase activity (Roadblock/LC7/MglB family)